MGKRKRTKNLDHILKKIRKLESKLKRRKELTSESDESDTHRDADDPQSNEGIPVDFPYDDNENDNPNSLDGCVDLTSASTKEPESEAKNKDTDIDPEVLVLLGEDPLSIHNHGDNINEHVAPRWQHILLNGLPKEVKTDMLKQYVVPANCTNLKAPKLNPEVKAALNKSNLKKDFFSESKQNQLSGCLTALGKVLDKALELNLTQDLLKPLSDAGRLLCDYHYRESQSRRYAIMNTLNKETRDAVKDTKIDEFLFGSELSEQLKSAKAISKSGSDMRATFTRPPTRPQANAPQRTLNSRGASRAAATETRSAPYTTARRRPAPPAPPARPAAPPARQQGPRDRGRHRDFQNNRPNNRPRTQYQR